MRPTTSERAFECFFSASTNAESLLKYKPGGHHPVHLGDTFSTLPGTTDPRYRVIQKLGHGSFSTVWLAEDFSYDSRAVAMKITVADEDANSRREADILKYLYPADSDASEHPGKQHVLRLLDHFEIKGPNGTHQVLVTDVLVPLESLQDMSLKDTSFDWKRACYESLLGLSYLAHKGIVHGDLHTANIAFNFPALNTLTGQKVASLMDMISFPVLPRRMEDQSDSLPKYLIERADFFTLMGDLIGKHGTRGTHAVIVDFGLAFRVSDPVPDPCTAIAFRPPEALLRNGINERCWDFVTRSQGDIWSLGCCIYTIFHRTLLFWIPGGDDKVLATMEQVTTALCEISGSQTQLEGATTISPKTSRLRCDKVLAELLSHMLRMNPAERQAPEILLNSPWFDSVKGETTMP